MNGKIEEWLERLIGHEGGYVNDSADPGGETKWGICKRSYPQLNIKMLSVSQAAEIYIRDFIGPLQAESYHDGVGFQLFDFAVNSGAQTAIRYLQREIGVADDGYVGPVTIERLNEASESDLIQLITASRIEFMTKLKNWPNHGKGWMVRMAKNLRYGAIDSE